MRKMTLRFLAGAALSLLLPLAASAQTSSIAGEVKDTSGAVLPGVTVEVASPALIEKVRSATTDGSGQYKIVSLRSGIYTVTFTLPGFNTVKRENVELTSDFTATINGELKVGSIEETISVIAESPIVDVQSITTRTVMTREVMDALPTGRNIQAVGIMIPGTALALGGGGALSRDVGGSGNLQQSPLQYRGSGDTVQTIEGLRLNNLCAQGAYSGVYWNDGSFQELSYVTGADSAEMGQGGMRVNMVPKDGGNTFRGVFQGNYAGSSFTSDNCKSPGVGLACASSGLAGDLTYNYAGVTATNLAGNALTNVSNVQKIYDINPSIGGPIVKDKIWFNYTFRHWGVDKTVADSFFNLETDPTKPYRPDTSRPGIDDGHIVSNAGRIAIQLSEKDKVAWYHDQQHKYRDHWGISANVPPDASGIQVTPISFVDVTKWTRTQTSRLLLEAGFGMYDQEYTELYQPEVTGQTSKIYDAGPIAASKVYTQCDNATGTCSAGVGKITGAWNAPADHFSKLRTFSGAASYVTGSHSFRFGGAFTNGDWRLVRQWTLDAAPVEFTTSTTAGVTTTVPTAVTLRLPTDRKNGIKMDLGIFAQDRWTLGRFTVNAGIRYDNFVGESRASDILASRLAQADGVTPIAAKSYQACADGNFNLAAAPAGTASDPTKYQCAGTVQNWKDISPRVGVAWDVFGNGKTAVKGSWARYVAGQQIAIADAVNPVSALTITDRRTWTDADSNGKPFDANGNIQYNELTASSSTASFGSGASTTFYDSDVLNGWGKRGYNNEITFAAQHQLAARISLNGGWFRRTFGNQTVTDDLRYSNSDYDGPFCITAPQNANLPEGGGYSVCGLYELKAVKPNAQSLVTFSKNFGDGETNLYEGFDVNLDARLPKGAFLRGGITAGRRTFDQCNLLVVDSPNDETWDFDGTHNCHREYGYRPDAKVSGSYTLPLNIQFSGTYQFTRGVQTGGAAPGILATWTLLSANLAPATTGTVNSTLGRGLATGVTSKSISLMREGIDYGPDNLHQIDLRASKRFSVNRYRMRLDFDLYNVLNSNWAYTRSSTFSTASTSAWLKPTNVLQQRFFKIGAQLDF